MNLEPKKINDAKDWVGDEPFQNTLIDTIFKRILAGEILSEIDVNKFSFMLFTIGVNNDTQLNDFKKLITKFRQAIPNFLIKIDEALTISEKNHIIIYKTCVNEIKRVKSLPALASRFDSPEMVTFIRSLKNDHYSFSAAETILGKSRQTLTKYADEQTHGLKVYWVKKSKRLLKEDMITFYRELHFKNYDPFASLVQN